MAYCGMCGSPIPDNQGRTCSVCYGGEGRLRARIAQTVPAIPPVFAGRPFSPSTPAGVTGQLLFCWLIALCCVVFAIWASVWSSVSQPIWIGDLFFIRPLWIALAAWFWVVVLFSQCGVMAGARHAICPACARKVRFWTTTTAFPCPFCKRTLMQHGNNLYDITGGTA